MQVQKKGGNIVIHLTTWEKIWSLHGNFQIPKSNIVSIKKGYPDSSWLDLKLPGTFLPGVIKAGTYISSRGKEYWYWTKNRPYVYTVELANMPYKRLVLSSTERIFSGLNQ